MQPGDTFLFNLDPGEMRHLWIVIAKQSGQVAIVNFTSKTPDSMDDSCIITADEHPFVVRDTVVNYRLGKMGDDSALEGAKAHGLLEIQEPVSPEILRRIQEGALASPYAAQKIQQTVQAELA